jgi:ABC-type amino acid transport system permease subunit
VILAIVVYIGLAFAHGQIEWRYVARFLTAKSILTGLVNTIVMTVLAMALGVALGVITAIMRLSTNPVLQTVAHGVDARIPVAWNPFLSRHPMSDRWKRSACRSTV